VLIVEDNVDMSRFVAEVLAEEYRVVTAGDGQEGLEKAMALRPDLILSDVMMPRLSGDELLRAVRAAPELQAVPVVILSAKEDDELRIKLLREGAQDFVTKPIASRELLARVGNLIDMRRARQVLEAELQGRSGTLEALARELAAHKRQLAATLVALEKTESQLRQTQKMEAIGCLAAGVAHDFNNLLTVILGSCAFLDSDLAAEPAARESVQAIEQAGVRAARLTSQLLAFSRQQVLAPQIVDLNDIILRMHAMLSRLIGADVEFTVKSAPDLGLVKVDPSQLEQVILNLVVNARDAMPGGGILQVSTANVSGAEEAGAGSSEKSAPTEYVELAISDNGVGMDETTRQRLFEPFFTTKDPGKGTGLGLSTVFGIVKQSGGDIEVSSESGRGATFRVRLPRSYETAPGEPLRRSQAASGGSETILLAEDDDQVRALVRKVLEKCGYTVLAARSGLEALDLQRSFSGPIQLLLTDVIMPALSGAELARRITVARPSIKILFMSGYTGDTALHNGELVSAFAFLQKPLAPLSLARKVRELLDGG